MISARNSMYKPTLLLLLVALALAADQNSSNPSTVNPGILDDIFAKTPPGNVADQSSDDPSTVNPGIFDEIFGITSPKSVGEVANGEKCELRGQSGVCVAYYLCESESSPSGGTGIVDININDEPCKQVLDVCCVTKVSKEALITIKE